MATTTPASVTQSPVEPAAAESTRDQPSSQIFRASFGLRERLLAHPLYDEVSDRAHAQTFMRHHVFAVWDFMSLLTRLQLDLTGCRLPWVPAADGEIVRFINEIVLGEASDVRPDGASHDSHFALYRDAMLEVGAATEGIDGFIARLHEGHPVRAAFGPEVPDFVASFVTANCELAEHGTLEEVAAAFCFGREDIIPGMFERLLDTLRTHDEPLPLLTYYVERHIEVDGDHHGPLAMRLIDAVVGDDPDRLGRAMAAAQDALERRIAFWDGVRASLRSETGQPA